MKTKQKLPQGWDEDRVRRVAEHYEGQTDDPAVEEDDAPEERLEGVWARS